MDKVTRLCPQTTNLFDEKGEPKRYRNEILSLTSLTPCRLGQAGQIEQYLLIAFIKRYSLLPEATRIISDTPHETTCIGRHASLCDSVTVCTINFALDLDSHLSMRTDSTSK